jgi:hypothetical protein
MLLGHAATLGLVLLSAPGPSGATDGARERFIALLTSRTPGAGMPALAGGPISPRQFAPIIQARRLARNQLALNNQATRLAGVAPVNEIREQRLRVMELATLRQLQRNLARLEAQIQRLSRLQSSNPRVQASIAALQTQAALISEQSRQLINRLNGGPPTSGGTPDRPPATPSR